MAIIVKDTGGASFDQIQAGTYAARCYGVVLLGTKLNEFNGKQQTRVLVQFEFPTELIDCTESDFHGQPYGLSKFYTLSLHEKANLRLDLERWRNRPFTPEELEGFDLKNIIGVPCMCSVVHNEKGKANISSVSALPKGMTVPPQINPSRYFDDILNDAALEKLPKGIQGMIKESDEYKAAQDNTNQALSDAPVFDDDESIPF